MQHHSGRDSKGMGTKLYVRGACFEEFDRIQSRNHGRLMCVMYLVSTFTSDTPDISCARHSFLQSRLFTNLCVDIIHFHPAVNMYQNMYQN
jgi:hypothetical protein